MLISTSLKGSVLIFGEYSRFIVSIEGLAIGNDYGGRGWGGLYRKK